ncbi:N-acetylglutamate synthase, GNAT family [Roseateles sp. YR242]|uniref:GNAT family N-acetyltransferase n=1 Tax=Roseateles sp. YR242 TaxID=1855305 RepID=UPI0008BD85D6|nr:GNAT family N-acetyltransferase [Roseateles sp. YR242]SEL92917.1 N-acetylglutamate synthase, GNAT family [Roseateles sp. YR242]
MHIRDFNVATDLPATAALFSQLGYPVIENTLMNRVQASAHDQTASLLVAEDNGRVVGVVAMHTLTPWHEATRWAVISALVVDESVRGNGAGAMLLASAERVAGTKGCSHVELSSNEARLRAHSFYERAGYSEVRKRFVKRFALQATSA